jgi:sulfur carrier protein
MGMNIYINNKLQELKESATLSETLIALNISSQRGIAIAINNNVIPKKDWDIYCLHDNDQVTLIKATQGG